MGIWGMDGDERHIADLLGLRRLGIYSTDYFMGMMEEVEWIEGFYGLRDGGPIGG